MAGKNNPIKLSDLEKKDPFVVPEGYFDRLPERVQERIATREKDGGRVVMFRPKIAYIGLAIAASITLLIVLLPALRQTSEEVPVHEQLLAEVTDADCLAYLASTELETEEIIGMLDAIPVEGETQEDLPAPYPELEEEDLDLLYERFGVSPDEKLQTL